MQRLVLRRAEQATAGPDAVYRSAVVQDVDVDADTTPGQRVVEVGQGGGEPAKRSSEPGGQPGVADR